MASPRARDARVRRVRARISCDLGRLGRGLGMVRCVGFITGARDATVLFLDISENFRNIQSQ